MLAGREITGGENGTPEPAARELVFNSIFYAVGTRCGFDLGSEETDLGAIVNVKDEGCISVLGTLVSDVSCTVLRNMNHEIMKIEKERKAGRMEHSPDKFGKELPNLQQNPSGKGGRNGTGNQLPRGSGRDAVPGHQSSGADGNRDIREVRNHGRGVSGGKLPGEIPESGKVREPLHETERSGGGGKPDVRQPHGEVSGKTQAGEPGFHNGNVPHPETGNDGSRGDYQTRPHQPVSLETQDVQEQFDSYAIPDEADQMGVPDAVRYEQEQKINDRHVPYDEIGMTEREPSEQHQEQKKEKIPPEQADKRNEPSAFSDKTDTTETEDTIEKVQPEKNPFSEFDGAENKEQVPAAVEIENEKAGESHNYVIDIHRQETGGERTRCKWNVDAIKTLKRVEAENRHATPEEQEVLARYAGWGGTSQAFDERNESWRKEYAELKSLLTPEEYREARATVTTAFYTPPEVAAAIGEALVQFGFAGGNVLEPSMGTGHFFGTMPAQLRGSRLFGVEKDNISGRIARLLYPQADIQVKGFEETDFPDNFFDVVVGNVPFGDFKVYDRKYNAENFKIHDYFVAKSIDKVRPGGMVAVITTKGTMENLEKAVGECRGQQERAGQAESTLENCVVAEPQGEYGAELFEKYQREHGAEQTVKSAGQTVTQEVEKSR